MLNIILSIIGGICIAMVIWAFIKFKSLRIFIGVAVLAVLVFTGFISGARLNQYYNTKGGIIGQITGVYKKNEVTTTQDNNINFKIDNTNFSKNSDDKYSIEISSDKNLKLKENEFYYVKVNNEPCQILFSSKNAVQATYTYLFQNNKLISDNYEEITIDTMVINFSSYGNYSKLIIEIDGGSETAPLWESYFEKNNFTITIEKVSEVEILKYSELKTITLLANGEIYSRVKLKTGSDYILPNSIDINGYIFNYFELNGERVDKISDIKSDITINANLTKICKVKVSANIDEQDFNSNIMGEYDIPAGIRVAEATTLIQNNVMFQDYLSERKLTGYNLIGFTTEKGFTTDSSKINNDFIIQEDMTLYAVWQAKGYTVKVVSNGSNYKIGELEKSGDFELKSPYDYSLTLTFVNSNSDDEVFSNYKIYFSNYLNETKILTTEQVTFSIKGMYKSLLDNYDPSEYVSPADRIEFESVGNLVIEIYTKENLHEKDWREDYTADELVEIKELESNLDKIFGLTYMQTVDYPMEETEFLNKLYKGITKEKDTPTNYEIKQILLGLFDVEITQEPSFIEFLRLFYEQAIKLK